MTEPQNVTDVRRRLAALRGAIDESELGNVGEVSGALDDLETELELYLFEDAEKLEALSGVLSDAVDLADTLKTKLEEA